MGRMDDYDRCFLDIPDGATATFCMVTSLVKPNASSDIWHIIDVRMQKLFALKLKRKYASCVSFCFRLKCVCVLVEHAVVSVRWNNLFVQSIYLF